jgi:hypothetical protein
MAAQNLPEISIDGDNLYREESYSDLKVGSIRKLIPVTRAGEDDPARDVRYEGSASLMTPAGNLPLSFELEADDLPGAIEKFPEAVNAAAERTVEELKEMQRQQSQQIQIPGQGGSGLGGGGQIQF